jgi:DNA-binding response OmpR family regulator
MPIILRAPQIMLVEDDVLLAMDVSAALSNAGHGIVGPFATVPSALHAAGTNPIDAAILDVDLKGQMSFPVADVLAGANVPFLWLSGSSADVIPHQHRVRPFLSKPFVPAVLLTAIAKILNIP